MAILESTGLDLGRYVWIYANLEPDIALHPITVTNRERAFAIPSSRPSINNCTRSES